jgi:hypothetical protein
MRSPSAAAHATRGPDVPAHAMRGTDAHARQRHLRPQPVPCTAPTSLPTP